MTVRPGTVYLVGAGPGDPGLITARGLELLERADAVVHDRLVDGSLLDRAPSSAERIDAGKSPDGDSTLQDDINALLVERARQGLVVVRLKGGDPLVFGRGYEEWLACREAGIPCEIVPGVTSAFAGPAAAGIPVTLRGEARSVAVVTAETAAGRFDRAALAAVAHADTLVVLMGVRRLPEVVDALVAAGRDPCTPAAIIERATLPGQRAVHARLDAVVEAARAADVRPPAVIVIGDTARLGCHGPWGATALPRSGTAVEDRTVGPLSGRRVLVTRPLHASAELAADLHALGANVITCPLIRIDLVDPEDPAFARRLEAFDWIVFTSRHGVRGFRRALERSGRDARALSRAKIAAVGPITERELVAWSLRADVRPESFRADTLCDALLQQEPPPRRVLFPCGTLALETIPHRLGARGIEVTPLVVYRTTLVSPDARARREIARGLDAVLFASPSAVRAFVDSGTEARGAAVICIGETTAGEARALGLPDVRVASPHSDAGLVAATLEALSAQAAAP